MRDRTALPDGDILGARAVVDAEYLVTHLEFGDGSPDFLDSTRELHPADRSSWATDADEDASKSVVLEGHRHRLATRDGRGVNLDETSSSLGVGRSKPSSTCSASSGAP